MSGTQNRKPIKQDLAGRLSRDALAVPAAQPERVHLRVAWLCGGVLLLEGYDIAATGYAIPSLADVWSVHPSAFTLVLAFGNIGLLLGSLGAGLLGDRLGRRPVLIGCVTAFGVFSLLSAFVHSPMELTCLRFLTGLGLGGGVPLAVALASDVAPPMAQGRLVTLVSIGVPIGFTLGGFLASQLVRLFGWPAIFVTGGMLPLAMVPLLAFALPESSVAQVMTQRPRLVAALFQDGLAPVTVLLWMINFLSLLGIFFILQWTPAILHSAGLSPARSILGTTMYALGVIVSPLLAASIVDRVGIERVLARGLFFGALCVLSIGLFNPRFWLLSIILCGAGCGGGCQNGINSLSALAYPSAIRSTGAGWALGAGRGGTVIGPLVGGALLALGFRAQQVFLAAAIPAFGAALLMAILGRLRRRDRVALGRMKAS